MHTIEEESDESYASSITPMICRAAFVQYFNSSSGFVDTTRYIKRSMNGSISVLMSLDEHQLPSKLKFAKQFS